MTDNEIINRWRDKIEGIKKTNCSVNNPQCIGSAVYGKDGCTCKSLKDTEYDSDPSAWDEALWDEIGKNDELIKVFIFYLAHPKSFPHALSSENWGLFHYDYVFQIIASTPAQKARALAQAITGSK